MIPTDFIVEWREYAPWVESSQVEQDLLLSRALVEIFRQPAVSGGLAFRGGTALYKLHLKPAARYSEDIDLVQVAAGPIGPLLDSIRSCLDSWLGEPKRTFGEGRVTMVYRVSSQDSPPLPLRVKVEINTREHFSVLDLERHRFEVRSRWFSGSAEILTYHLDELLGTKLRALYQRRKGRDLFDLWWAAENRPVEPDRVVDCFRRYLDHGGHKISRAEIEANLAAKLSEPEIAADLRPLLTASVAWDAGKAARYVLDNLLPHLPGEPWKGKPEG